MCKNSIIEAYAFEAIFSLRCAGIQKFKVPIRPFLDIKQRDLRSQCAIYVIRHTRSHVSLDLVNLTSAKPKATSQTAVNFPQ
jgi:hypothetical protein